MAFSFMITYQYATASDIDAYYGERPRPTMRAIAISLNGVPAAIIGLYFAGDRLMAFSEFKPELEPHLKSMTVLRAIKAAQRMFEQSKRPVYAVGDECSRILDRLGFKHIDDGVYRWLGECA